MIKMPRVSVLSLFHARSAYTLNLYIHSEKSQGSKKSYRLQIIFGSSTKNKLKV